MSPSAVTRPITAHGSPQRAQITASASYRSGRTTASMRSWVSVIITSKGARPGSRRGIASRSRRIPVPARSAISQVPPVMPAAPRPSSPTTRPRSRSSSVASMSGFSANGSPTWTAGRLPKARSPNVAEARTDAPPIPSRPVVEP